MENVVIKIPAVIKASHLLLGCINLESFTEEKLLEFGRLYEWATERLRLFSGEYMQNKALLNELVNARVVYNSNEDKNVDVYNLDTYITALHEIIYEWFCDFYYNYAHHIAENKFLDSNRDIFKILGVPEESLTKFFHKFLEIAQYKQDEFVYSIDIKKFRSTLDISYANNEILIETRDRFTKEVIKTFLSK